MAAPLNRQPNKAASTVYKLPRAHLYLTVLLLRAAKLGNRDVVPVAALQSQPRECQLYVMVLAPRGPPQVWDM